MVRITRIAFASLVALAGLAVAGSASAEGHFGLRGGFSSNPDQILVGVHYMSSPIAKQLYLVPSAEAGFGDNATTIAVNGDLQYQFTSSSSLRPYAGGGVSMYYIDVDNFGSDTNFGASVLGGIMFQREHGWPLFLEGKLGLTNEVPDFKLVLGLMFR